MATKEGVNGKFAGGMAAAGAMLVGAGAGSLPNPNIPLGTGIGQISLGAVNAIQNLNSLGIINDRTCKVLSGILLSVNSVPVVNGIMDIANGAIASGIGQLSLAAFSSTLCMNDLGLFDDVLPWKKKKSLEVNKQHLLGNETNAEMTNSTDEIKQL